MRKVPKVMVQRSIGRDAGRKHCYGFGHSWSDSKHTERRNDPKRLGVGR